MSRKIEVKVGDRYGRLVILREAPQKNKQRRFYCECDCGNITMSYLCDLRKGASKSCGCLSREKLIKSSTTHGYCKGHKPSRIYTVWLNMKRRCLKPNDPRYKDYGGRGIKICREWLEPSIFFEWAMSHGYQENLTIERIDNDGNYEPDNCTWATQAEQNRNQRLRRSNKTGYTGVQWREDHKRYLVYIAVNQKKLYLGSFVNIQDAITTRKTAELKYWESKDEVEQTESRGPGF